MARRDPTPIACQPSRRPAFTLVELIVSVAILLALMAMIGMIFSTAGKASGTAQASTALYRQLRQITDSIRQDLEAVDPTTGVMAIAGVDVTAYLTADDKANGVSPAGHRADVLMLLNKRDFDPYVFDPADHPGAIFEEPRQVIYGHANFARINPANGTWLAGTTRRVEGTLSEIPASQWHLARRIVGFTKLGVTGDNTGVWPLTSPAFTGEIGALARYADVYRGAWSAFNNAIWPGYFHYKAGKPDVFFTWYPSFASEKFLFVDASDYPVPRGSAMLKNGKWYRWRSGTNWVYEVVAPPYSETIAPSNTPPPLATFGTTGSTSCWPEWFYVNGSSRSLIDPNPPAGKDQRLAAYFLPGCADFKVEYTYDDPREIALNEDRTEPEPDMAKWLDRDKDGSQEMYPKPRPIHWRDVANGEQVVWSKLSTVPTDYDAGAGNVDLRDRTSPFRWPRAVRITIRVYDPAHRLTEPVTQTIVHAWQ